MADPSVEEFTRRVRVDGESTLELNRIHVDGNCVYSPDCSDLADELAAMAKECAELSGRPPTYSLIDDAELRLVMWAERPHATEAS